MGVRCDFSLTGRSCERSIRRLQSAGCSVTDWPKLASTWKQVETSDPGLHPQEESCSSRLARFPIDLRSGYREVNSFREISRSAVLQAQGFDGLSADDRSAGTELLKRD